MKKVGLVLGPSNIQKGRGMTDPIEKGNGNAQPKATGGDEASQRSRSGSGEEKKTFP